jgi:hypothetical protein
MRTIIFLTVLVGIALAILDRAEPQLMSETWSGANSVAGAVFAWFDD